MPRPPPRATVFEEAKEDGHAFTVGKVFRGLRKNETVQIFVNNESNSRSSVVGRAELESNGSFITTKRLNPTIDAAGTPLSESNLRSDSNATAQLVVEEGGEYSGGDPFPPNLSAIIGGTTAVSRPIIDPDDNLLITLECRNAGGADIGFTFEWVPLPENVLPPITDIDTGEEIP